MRTFKFIALVAIIILAFSTCKKYADDDRRYYKTACGRIARKWKLYKITDYTGKDYTNDTISYPLYDAAGSSENFVYRNMTLEFDKVSSWICAEVGLRGSVKCSNKKFSSGYYELINKRSAIRLDLIPLANNPERYFTDVYSIYKLTKDEFVFGSDAARAYFKVAD